MEHSGGKFAPGDVIFISRPFVSVLDRKWKFQRCDFCFELFPPRSDLLSPRPLTCQDCSACLYCDSGCRGLAKAGHEAECKYLRQKETGPENQGSSRAF